MSTGQASERGGTNGERGGEYARIDLLFSLGLERLEALLILLKLLLQAEGRIPEDVLVLCDPLSASK